MSDKDTKDGSAEHTLLGSFKTLIASYLRGYVRLLEAEVAASHARVALLCLRKEGTPKSTPEGPYSEAIEWLHKISYPEFDAFSYVTEVSYLVYSTTLLDSFLSDATRFLLLLHPASMGKELSIRLDSVITATSREDLLNLAAGKKVRDLSYLPFIARIEFLKNRFGLRLKLDAETIDALEHYSTLRNVIVHDQSIFEIGLVAGGSLAVEQKRCARHPTPLKRNDLAKAKRAHNKVVGGIFEAVVTQVLKGNLDADCEHMLDTLYGPNITEPSADGLGVAEGGG